MWSYHSREDFCNNYQLLSSMLPFILPSVQWQVEPLISPSAENKVSLKGGLHCYLLQWKQSYRTFLVQLFPSAPVIISHLFFFLHLLTATFIISCNRYSQQAKSLLHPGPNEVPLQPHSLSAVCKAAINWEWIIGGSETRGEKSDASSYPHPESWWDQETETALALQEEGGVHRSVKSRTRCWEGAI